MPTSLWFTAAYDHDDDHGYLCCSTCITDYTKWSGVPVAKWQRLHTPAQWMRYPEEAWRISIVRSQQLRELQDEVGAKAASKASKAARKRKRTTAAPAPAVAAPVVLDPSVASQVVSTFSHCEDFLDNLLAQAQRLPTVPRNDLTPTTTDAVVPTVPQNVLGTIDTTVPQNVVSPFAPLGPITPNPVAPVTTTQLSAADTRQLSQSLAKMEKLSEWIATALVEVRSVENVVRNILRR